MLGPWQIKVINILNAFIQKEEEKKKRGLFGYSKQTELFDFEDLKEFSEMLTRFMNLYQTLKHKSCSHNSAKAYVTLAGSWEAPRGRRMKFILITLQNELSGLE